MTAENGAATAAEEAAAGMAFLRENVDIEYLKEEIDISVVDSLLQEFGHAPKPMPETPTTEEPDTGQMLEPEEEESAVQRIKGLWKGTDKKLDEVDSRIDEVQTLFNKAREIRALKREYEESISKKLDN